MATLWLFGSPVRVQSTGTDVVPVWLFGTVTVVHDATGGVPPSVSETLPASEQQSAAVTRSVSTSETLSCNEAVSASSIKNAGLSDTVSISDASESDMGINPYLSDTLSIGDIPSASVTTNPSVYDSVHTTDSSVSNVNVFAVVSESLPISEDAESYLATNTGVAESNIISDTCEAEYIELALQEDSLNVNDSIVAEVIYNPSALEPLSITEISYGASVFSVSVNETLSVSDGSNAAVVTSDIITSGYDYTGLINTAYRLIDRFGAPLTITHSNEVVDPVSGVGDDAADTSFTFRAINPPASKGTIEAFDNRLIGMAAEIGKSVRFFILAAKGATLVPAANDAATFDGASYTVLGCTPIAPAGNASKICYKIGVAV